MEDINKKALLEKFCSYVSAKHKQALYLKLFFVSSTVIILSVLFYAYTIIKHASEQILVVSTGGQFLTTETMELDQLYKTLLAAHCYSVSYYANSFNVNNIKNNQARAAFLVNQTELNAIYGKYKYDQAYSDAINKGVVYQCEFNRIESLKSIDNGSMYDVVFISVLSVMDNVETKRFQIVSKGTAIRVTPRFPENPTGFYFKNYIQEYYSIN
jgi:hypothetical protein